MEFCVSFLFLKRDNERKLHFAPSPLYLISRLVWQSTQRKLRRTPQSTMQICLEDFDIGNMGEAALINHMEEK